jgi:hypothetical protein
MASLGQDVFLMHGLLVPHQGNVRNLEVSHIALNLKNAQCRIKVVASLPKNNSKSLRNTRSSPRYIDRSSQKLYISV